MARAPELTRKEVPRDGHAAFDEIAASRGSVHGVFAVMMGAPELARRTAQLGAYVRFEASLGDVDRELAALAASRAIGNDYESVAHTRLAPHFGVRPEAIEIINRDDGIEGLTAREATLVEFARELVRSYRVSEATFEAAREQLGEQALIELGATVGYYTMLGLFMNAFEIEPPDDEDWPPRPTRRAT